MGRTIISESVTENGSAVFTVAFTDPDENAVTPETITWSLYDSDDVIINSREDVAVVTPASTIYIVLDGDDLEIDSDDDVNRRLIISWTYNSTYGTGLNGREVVEFSIDDLQIYRSRRSPRR